MPVLTSDANPGTASWATTIVDVTNIQSADLAGGSANLTIETGDSSAGSSGDLILSTGTVASGQSKGKVSLSPTAQPQGWNAISPRYELQWIAGQHGKPGVNADIQSTKESVNAIADPQFEVVGLNAASAGTTYYAEGGILLTTAGGAADAQIVAPHLDANQSGWAQITWGTDREVQWECSLQPTATITNRIIHAGLKLTNTAVTATDANQAFFRFEDSVNGGRWQAIDSIANVDNAQDSGITVVAATTYHLKIIISATRIATFYINGFLVSTSAALTDAIDFIPYIGVTDDGTGAAVDVRVFGQAISRSVD